MLPESQAGVLTPEPTQKRPIVPDWPRRARSAFRAIFLGRIFDLRENGKRAGSLYESSALTIELRPQHSILLIKGGFFLLRHPCALQAHLAA
jgi:hypothetical protein